MGPPSHQHVCRNIAAELTSPDHATTVDMVLSCVGTDRYRAAAATGTVTFERSIDTQEATHRYHYEVVEITGQNPLANAATDVRTSLTEEQKAGALAVADNSYPFAFDQIAQFFDAPHAPDLVIQHTPAHHVGGLIGQHGSLSLVASRAPLILSGAGVTAQGRLPRTARMVDVAPTLLHLLGARPHPNGVGPTGAPRTDALLARQDGEVLVDLVEHGGAEHVVVILLDGCNANVLFDAMEHGRAPTLAALHEAGTSLGHGLIASLPTATLANHTTMFTGVHPGHSGVLHNMWLNRETGAVPDLLAMDQVFDAMGHLDIEVETLHEALHRNDPGCFTAALMEFCDRGADVSTFGGFRSGTPPTIPEVAELLDATSEFVATSATYSFMSRIDELATNQAVDLWARAIGNPLPALTILSLSLTDESGHEAGPYSEMATAAIIDSDRRAKRVVEVVEAAGCRDRTAFVVLADHGMEQSDATNAVTWTELLVDAENRHSIDGVACSLHNVADGFVYVVLG